MVALVIVDLQVPKKTPEMDQAYRGFEVRGSRWITKDLNVITREVDLVLVALRSCTDLKMHMNHDLFQTEE